MSHPAGIVTGYMGRTERRAGWNPWQALREWQAAELSMAELPNGVAAVSCPYGDRPAIVLDPSLTQVERNAALAHELIHLERGGTCAGAGWAEEERVEDEVARRLVPLGELLVWVVKLEQADVRVEPWMVAEEFHVPDAVAERAMRLLMEGTRADLAMRRRRLAVEYDGAS